MDAVVSSVSVNSREIGDMSDKVDKMLAVAFSMYEKLQGPKHDVTTRRSGGFDRVSKETRDVPKQKHGDGIAHQVRFANSAFDSLIIERCTILVVCMELLKRMENDVIPIVKFRKVLEMVIFSVQPMKSQRVVTKGRGLEVMLYVETSSRMVSITHKRTRSVC